MVSGGRVHLCSWQISFVLTKRMEAGWKKGTTGNWGWKGHERRCKPRGLWGKKRTERARNAFRVMMGIKGSFKLLERVTRGELTLCEEGKINEKQILRDSWPFHWKWMATHLVTGWEIHTSQSRQGEGDYVRLFFLECWFAKIHEWLACLHPLRKSDCFSETLISFTGSKPSIRSILEFRTHRMVILKWSF